MAEELLPNGFTQEGNASLLAQPLPNLRFAVYVPAESEVNPVAIFQDFNAALSWSLDIYGQSAEVRKIQLYSDRLPVAPPIKWRSDT
jgi:hypothetical protein